MSALAGLMWFAAWGLAVPGWVLSRPLNARRLMYRAGACWLACAADWLFVVDAHSRAFQHAGWLRWFDLGGALLFGYFAVEWTQKTEKARQAEHPEWRKS